MANATMEMIGWPATRIAGLGPPGAAPAVAAAGRPGATRRAAGVAPEADAAGGLLAQLRAHWPRGRR